VNFTSLQCYGPILVVKMLRKRFLNINSASDVLAKYEALNNYPITLFENEVAHFIGLPPLSLRG